MSLKFSMIVELKERVSKQARAAKQGMDNLGRSASEMAQRARPVAGGMDRMSRAAVRLRSKTMAMVAAARRAAGPRGLDLIGKAADKAGFATGRLIRKMGGMTVAAAKWAAIGGAAAGGFALFDMFRTAGQFEQFEIMLEGIQGSAAAAKSSMDWVKEFASTTPFEISQVMEAFVRLKAFGLEPTDGTLRDLGDTAAGMGKDLMQAVEMFTDAATGEFERLKEFGIKARTEGERVTFSYMQNGKELTKTVQKNATGIKVALSEIMSDKFAGGMVRQSKTLNGLISNLKDRWTNFQLAIADAGIFDRVKKGAEEFLSTVERLAADGTLEQWAKDISDGLEWAWEKGEQFVKDTDWQQVGTDLQRIAKAAWDIATAITSIMEKGQQFSNSSFLSDLGSRFGITPGMRATVRVIQNEFLNGDNPSAAKPQSVPKLDNRSPAQRKAAQGASSRPASPNFFPKSRPAADPFLRNIPRANTSRSTMPRADISKISANKVDVGGKLEVGIDVRGPGKASIKSQSNKDIPWRVALARTMEAAA